MKLTRRNLLLSSLCLFLLALSPGLQARQQNNAPIRVPGGVMAKLIVSKVEPVYPPEAKSQHISGAVVLVAVISAEGRIVKLEAVSGPAALREAAVIAVQQWTYKPYLLNGQPRAVQTSVNINFSLSA